MAAIIEIEVFRDRSGIKRCAGSSSSGQIQRGRYERLSGANDNETSGRGSEKRPGSDATRKPAAQFASCNGSVDDSVTSSTGTRDIEVRTRAGYGGVMTNGSEHRLPRNNGSDDIEVGAGCEFLNGGAEFDKLEGGSGRAVLAGGGGRDEFEFDFLRDSGSGALRDIIQDFAQGVDLIGDSNFDAVPCAGNPYFSFIGYGAFGNSADNSRLELTADGKFQTRRPGHLRFA